MNRRELLQALGIGAAGITLPGLLPAEAWETTMPDTTGSHIGNLYPFVAAQALARLRLADQPMALVAPVALDLAGRGDAEALFRAALGFHLGHFPSLFEVAAARHALGR